MFILGHSVVHNSSNFVEQNRDVELDKPVIDVIIPAFNEEQSIRLGPVRDTFRACAGSNRL